jgi:hypothetical protein
MSWTRQGNKLIGIADEQYDINPHEFWYVVPARTHYSTFDGTKVRPLEFAFVLHNAKLAKGLLISQTHMAHGIAPTTLKGGAGAAAETLLESVRRAQFPAMPSRLQCYFLNHDRDTAEFRMRDSLRGNRTLVRCHIVLNGARVHFADSRVYEKLEGRPDDHALATSYWQQFDPKSEDDWKSLEVIADAALYFPDWATFPTIPFETLARWQEDNPPQPQ